MALGSLQYCDVSFAYPGKTVLSHANWSVGSGEFAVLVGGTGSGKTTLLRCAKPELTPTGELEGEVAVDGVSVRELAPGQSASALGYVAQNPDSQIVCDTVWHQLAFGLENLGKPQDQMRRIIAEVSHFLGIASWFRMKTDTLSGGQRQLLALASVLVMEPKVLLLDEPTSMLDPIAQRDFLHVLMRLNRELGLTVVVATHSPHAFAPYATGFFGLVDQAVVPLNLSELDTLPVDFELPSVFDRPTSQDLIVRAKDAYARYGRGQEFVLRGLSMEVLQGQIHAVVGGNGCGKSTLLRAVAGLMKVERGRIANSLAKKQAFLPQDPKALFTADTVIEELKEWQRGCRYGDEAIGEALDQFGLHGCENLHPYDLSGGQQQLLALAKLSLTKAELFILDEPTKGLDPAARGQLALTLLNLASQGGTVLLATHDLAFASCVATVVTLLFDGQSACTQPADDFFSESLFYVPEEDSFYRAFHGNGGEPR